jgi:hypothetical protein
VIFKLAVVLAIDGYIAAWIAVVRGDYIYALIYGVVAFTIWIINLELRELTKEGSNG